MKYMDVVGLKPFFVCLGAFALLQFAFLNPDKPVMAVASLGTFSVGWFFTSWLTWRRLRSR